MKPEIATKLLKGAGFTDELLKKAEEPDFKPEDAIEAVNNSQKEHYETLLRNELTASITKEASATTAAEILNKLNHSLKKSGVPVNDIDHATVAEKVIAAEKFFKEKFSKIDDESKLKKQFQELEEKYLKVTNEVTEKEEQWNKKYEDVKKESESKLTRDKVDIRLMRDFNAIPDNRVLGGKKQENHYVAVKANIDAKYDTSLDEKGNVVYLEKGTQKRVTFKREGKEDFLTSQDIFPSELKGLNLWVESNGQGQTTPKPVTTTTTETDTTKPTSSRLQQMKETVGA